LSLPNGRDDSSASARLEAQNFHTLGACKVKGNFVRLVSLRVKPNSYSTTCQA